VREKIDLQFDNVVVAQVDGGHFLDVTVLRQLESQGAAGGPAGVDARVALELLHLDVRIPGQVILERVEVPLLAVVAAAGARNLTFGGELFPMAEQETSDCG
jgi:hypothetical protein